jgi:hypothetical protein
VQPWVQRLRYSIHGIFSLISKVTFSHLTNLAKKAEIILENSDILLYVIVITAFVVPCSQFLRWLKLCQLSKSKDIVSATIAIATISFQLNYFLHYCLQSKARSDLFGILTVSEVIALLGGNAFASSLSIEKIINLFPPSDKLDEQTEQLISRMLEKGISQEVIAYIAQVSIQQIQTYLSNNSSASNVQIDSDEIDSTIPSQIISETPPIANEEKEKDSI